MDDTVLNSQHLITFKLLVEQESFTQTARSLGITQPAVSQHIQKLEHELGRVLLIRHGRKIELTNAGKTLYQHAQDLEKEYQDLMTRWLQTA
jgi:DNA-binding transcriptional LysR family regulator